MGQAVEALETVPLLATALSDAGIEAPVTRALAELISGELPLESWVGVVRTTVPPPARWRPAVPPGFWRRVRERVRNWFAGLRGNSHEMFTQAEGDGATVGSEPDPKERERCRRSS